MLGCVSSGTLFTRLRRVNSLPALSGTQTARLTIPIEGYRIIDMNPITSLNQSRARAEYQWRKRGVRGATVLMYDALLKLQNGGCQLCGKVPEKNRLTLDFNPTSGQIRGLLCRNCDTLVSQIELVSKDKARLDKVMDYIAANGEPLFSEAQTAVKSWDNFVVNGKVQDRRDKVFRRIQQLAVPDLLSREEMFKQVAAEYNISVRTVKRYLGMS